MINYLNNLKIFFEEPILELHIRQYARLINKAPATALKYLNAAVKKGYLQKRKERMLILYRANFKNENYIDLKKFYNLKKIKKSGIIAYLSDEFNVPETIILFGSYADGTNDKQSDIDLCVISPLKKKVELKIFEKKLKTKIQLFALSKFELRENPKLANNILNGIKLLGFLEVYS